jgi:hypothetical protein
MTTRDLSTVIPGSGAVVENSHVALSSNRVDTRVSPVSEHRRPSASIDHAFYRKENLRDSRPVAGNITCNGVPSNRCQVSCPFVDMIVHSRECHGWKIDSHHSRIGVAFYFRSLASGHYHSRGNHRVLPTLAWSRYRPRIPDQSRCRCLAAKPAPGCRPLGEHRVMLVLRGIIFLSPPRASRTGRLASGWKGRTCTKHVARTCSSSLSGSAIQSCSDAREAIVVHDLHTILTIGLNLLSVEAFHTYVCWAFHFNIEI